MPGAGLQKGREELTWLNARPPIQGTLVRMLRSVLIDAIRECEAERRALPAQDRAHLDDLLDRLQEALVRAGGPAEPPIARQHEPGIVAHRR